MPSPKSPTNRILLNQLVEPGLAEPDITPYFRVLQLARPAKPPKRLTWGPEALLVESQVGDGIPRGQQVLGQGDPHVPGTASSTLSPGSDREQVVGGGYCRGFLPVSVASSVAEVATCCEAIGTG